MSLAKNAEVGINTSANTSKLSIGYSRSYIVVILYILIGFGIYFNALDNPFQFDDDNVIINNINIRDIRNIPRFFIEPRLSTSNPVESGHYRPFVTTSYALNYAIGGLNPIGYHLVNLFFHIGTAFLIFLIVKAMLGNSEQLAVSSKQLEAKSAHSSQLIANYVAALAGGLIFLVHPFNSEAVNYITARSSVMSGFFYLLAFWCWVRYRSKQMPVIASEAKQSEKGIASGILFPRNDNRKVFYIASLLAFIAGMLSKEVAITLPIVLWLYDLYFQDILQSTPTLTLPRQGGGAKGDGILQLRGGGEKGGGIFLWRNYIPYIPFVLMVIIPYLLMRFFSLGKVLDRFQRDIITQIFTEIPVLVKHWQMFIFPGGLSLAHDVKIYNGISLALSFSIILCFLYIASAVYLFRSENRHWRILSYFMFWFLIVLLPTTIIPLNAIFQENRGYLAFVSFAVIAAVILKHLDRFAGRRVVMSAVAVLLVIYSILVVQRNTVWGDVVGFWKDAVRKAPDSAMAYSGLTGAYIRHGDVFISIESAKKGLSIAPDNFYLRVNLAMGYEYINNIDGAIQEFKNAINIDSEHGDVWNELGTLYMKKDDMKRAEACFREGIKVWDTFPPLFYNLGRIFAERSEYAEALDEYEMAVRLNPAYIQARYEMAEALKKLGRLAEADEQYRKILQYGEADPDYLTFTNEKDRETAKIIVENVKRQFVKSN